MAKKQSPQDSSELDQSLFSDYEALIRLSLKELKVIAKNLKIKNSSKLDKTDLAKLITETISLVESPKKERKTKKIQKLAQELKNASPDEKNFFSDYDALVSLSRKELKVIAKDLQIENSSKLAKPDLAKVIIETKSFRQTKDKSAETDQKKSNETNLASEKKEKAEKEQKSVKTAKESLQLDSESKTSGKAITKNKNKFIESFKPENISDLSQAIDLIGKNLKQGFIDEREASVLEKEITDKFLLKPSKFSFGNVNKEFLLEDEENIDLPSTYEEDKLVLLPVDPAKLYLYWDLSPETMAVLGAFKPSELLLKINDVTGIIYNGGNAKGFWFESCPVDSRNFYINLDEGNRNICVELGFSRNGLFRSLVTSNTVYIPRRYPSSFLKDTFVVVDYQKEEKEEEKIPSFGEQTDQPETPSFKIPPSFKKTLGKSEKPYVFFKKEFSAPVKKEEPPALIDFSEMKKQKEQQKEDVFSPNPVIVREEKLPIFQEEKKQIITFPQPPLPDYFIEEYPEPKPVIIPRQEISQITINKPVSKQEIIIPAESEREIFFPDIVREKPLEKIIVESGEESETRWFWVSETIPVPHEQLFRISWGPVWVREFVGGSEVYRYQGASERFVGSSERFLGGSERFPGASERFIGGSERFPGGSEKFPGASERFVGGSEHFPGGSEVFLGGSEVIRFLDGSEEIYHFLPYLFSYLRKYA